MIIKEILAQLGQTQEGPVIKMIENKEHFKIIAIAFKKDMVLKAHKTAVPARLIVIEGEVTTLKRTGLSFLLSLKIFAFL